MRYSWDREKNRRNLIRHGIAFEDAKRIFDGPTVEKVDDRFDYGEIRVYAVGLVNGLEVTVVYTDENDDERRLISAWRAARTTLLLAKHRELSKARLRTGTNCVTGPTLRYAMALPPTPTRAPRIKSSGKTPKSYGPPEKRL
jgi:uncharacterized protein